MDILVLSFQDIQNIRRTVKYTSLEVLVFPDAGDGSPTMKAVIYWSSRLVPWDLGVTGSFKGDFMEILFLTS